MDDVIDARRREYGFSVLGGPTTVIDIGGRRIVMDPAFDPPGPHDYLTKTTGPAIAAAALGDVDLVLISHDEHLDNLDVAGRELAAAAPLVLTHPGAARRLGPPARGLQPWHSLDLPAGHGRTTLTVQAVPAVHGPADGARDAGGYVNCEVTGFVLSGPDVPTVYLSGDNASLAVVQDISQRIGVIDVAVLFAGAARVPAKDDGRPLTFTSPRAAAAAELLEAPVVIPAHVDGWAHFSEGIEDLAAAFAEAGIGHVLARAPHGTWITPPATRR